MRRARRFPQRLVRWTSLSVCLALVLTSLATVPLAGSNNSIALAQGSTDSPNGKGRRVTPAPPAPGAPAANLPNLNEVRRTRQPEPEAPPGMPSIMRSRRKPIESRRGRKVGDPGTTSGRIGTNQTKDSKTKGAEYSAKGAKDFPLRSSAKTSAASSFSSFSVPAFKQGKFHHGSKSAIGNRKSAMSAPVPLADDQFIQDFFYRSLGRYAYNDELTYWTDILRAAYPQGFNAMKYSGRELGMTLFESADYSARNRNDHWFVFDLYWSYLRHDPDEGGWAFWESMVPSIGRENVRHAFDECGEWYDVIGSVTPNGSATSAVSSLSTARVNPFNQTGNQLQARDCEWSVGLLSLSGRAGLDLGLGLSYSSLVLTRSGPYLYFNEDNSSPSPGFRLGFATIQPKYFDAQVGRNVYMLITSSGSRVELRQVGTSNVYEAGDSSYLQLINNGSSLLVRTTDGTQMTYQQFENEWYVTQIKDRNGNYLTVTYNSQSDLSTITDTLGRVIYFNYDGNANLTSITQNWNGWWRTLVSFGWGANLTLNLSSLSGVSVVGAHTGDSIPVLRQVGLLDGSYYTFEYSVVGQVNMIRRYTYDNVERSHTAYDYDNSSSDCPRLTQMRVFAENWTGINGLPYEVATQFSGASDHSWRAMTVPDGTVYNESYGTGWQKGLVTQSEVWSGGVRQKWITTGWTQDNTGVSYQTNPRVTETNIYDAQGNRNRSTVSYQAFTLPSGASCSLPSDTYQYWSDGSTILRRTHADYNLDSTYTTRHIIGLPATHLLCDGAQGATPCTDSSGSSLLSKTTLQYDENGSVQYQGSAVQHDDSNYGAGFVPGRGNVSSARRYNANNTSQYTVSSVQYNTAGSVITATDPLNHQSTISYADSFSDGVNHNTFAYATTLTDADGHSSSVQYNYDYGAQTRLQGPPPAGQSQGLIQTFSYDAAVRIEQITTVNTGAYTRHWYGANYVGSYQSINSAADELFTNRIFDGAGHLIAISNNNPGSAGGYRARWTEYDAMGRVKRQSNPTEILWDWSPYGDDAAGRLYTTQTYDWKGRPLVTTNQDGTQKYASYTGCGCAGGEVATLTDEGTLVNGVPQARQQKIYSDVLGRLSKTEVLNWNGSVYSTTANSYDARDQVTAVKTYNGAAPSDFSCPTGTCMQSVTTYDGHGRVATHKLPQQTASSSYAYNADDTVQSVTDPRGVIATNSYNNRHLLTGVSYTPAGNVPALAPVSFGYDAAGNRTSMSDGTGSISYSYNALSRLTSETRTFTGLSNQYTISYGYNLSGALTNITDPSGAQVSYNYDQAGRLTSMPASGYSGITQFLSNLQYRASGAMKHATYGNSVQVDLTYNSRMQIGQYQATGLYAWQGGPAVTMGATMAYYADGRTNTAYDLNHGSFDRKYEFDFSARLKEAYSGVEAHGAPPPPLNQANSPYRQTYTYDEWNNVTLRTGRIWSTQNEYDWASYGTDNRRGGWEYDAAGNATFTGYSDGTRTYDAAGRPVTFTSSQNWQVWPDWPAGHPDGPTLETQDTFDGTGQVVKHVNHTRHDDSYDGGYGLIYTMSDTTTTTYYVHSTVLGGKTIAELDQNGYKMTGYVYAGGARIATQHLWTGGGNVEIESTNPVTGAAFTTDANGNGATRQEPDPLGRELATPPDPTVVVDPISNSKWNEPMPIEYAPNWTGEMESGMGIYVDTMQMIMAREAYKRWLKTGDGTTNTDYNIWQNILTKNPNVGIVKGKKTLWGKDATTFLEDNADFMYLGGRGITFRPQNTSHDKSRSLPPCVGVKASQLDYSHTRGYGKYKESAEGHIKRRHINAANSKTGSQYRDSLNPTATQGQIFELVKTFNALTFLSPDSIQVVAPYGPVTSYVFVKNIRPDDVGNRVVGINRDSDGGQPTAVNTLFVSADCKTVNSSHPGPGRID